MDWTEALEWLFQHSSLRVSEIVLLLGAIFLLAYGIFDGDPPLFKKRKLSVGARRKCLLFGTLAALGFFVLLPFPFLADYMFAKEARLMVNGDVAPDGTWFAAFSSDGSGKRVEGSVGIQLGSVNLRIPNADPMPPEWRTHKGELRFTSNGSDLTARKLYVADGDARAPISDPLRVVDELGNEFASVSPSPGNFIFPRDERVVLLDTRFLYQNAKGENRVGRLGSRLDCERNDCGPQTHVLERYSDPVSLICDMVDDSFDGEETSANVVFNSEKLVATSRIFPVGAVLRLENPLENPPSSVEVRVIGRTRPPCSLSRKAFGRLGLTPGRARLRVRVVDYVHQVPHRDEEFARSN